MMIITVSAITWGAAHAIGLALYAAGIMGLRDSWLAHEGTFQDWLGA